MNFYSAFKNIVFKFDPEHVHDLTMLGMHNFPPLALPWKSHWQNDSKFGLKVGKQNWNFPVGLAAGLDKNAVAIPFFEQLGFGAIEVGTITPLPQDGNPRPRIFRYPEIESLRNAMGFPNQGMEVISQNVSQNQQRKGPTIIGANLGKNKTSEGDKAIDDYTTLYKKFSPLSDYLVINVSSPNTPGLRTWLQKGPLQDLLSPLGKLREQDNNDLYLKISPDLEQEDIQTIIDVCLENKITGIIATNTTIDPTRGTGGMSGQVLFQKAKKIRTCCLERTKGTPLEFIGVGGFSQAQELFDFWREGGRAIQIYTSFIYQGPGILKQFANEIDLLLAKTKAKNLEELLQHPKDIPS